MDDNSVGRGNAAGADQVPKESSSSPLLGEQTKSLEEKRSAPVATRESQMECEESVIDLIRRRRTKGRNKYGRSMERSDLTMREWLTHAQEEALDLAIYLEAVIRRLPEGMQ